MTYFKRMDNKIHKRKSRIIGIFYMKHRQLKKRLNSYLKYNLTHKGRELSDKFIKTVIIEELTYPGTDEDIKFFLKKYPEWLAYFI